MIPRRLGEAVHDRETEARGIRALANDGIDGVAIEVEEAGEEVVREALFILPMSPDENRKSLGEKTSRFFADEETILLIRLFRKGEDFLCHLLRLSRIHGERRRRRIVAILHAGCLRMCVVFGECAVYRRRDGR